MRTLSIVIIAALLPSWAAAQEQAAPEAPTTPPYMTKVQNGLRLAVARDFDGAMASLREAVQLDGAKPAAHYYIGEVERMRGNLNEALAAFRAAAGHAQTANDPAWQARALQAVAETLERQEDQLEAARTAWTEHARFADANRAAANPEIARARIQAIDVVNEQEQAYIAVRERIAARERENAESQEEEPQRRGRQRRRQGGD